MTDHIADESLALGGDDETGGTGLGGGVVNGRGYVASFEYAVADGGEGQSGITGAEIFGKPVDEALALVLGGAGRLDEVVLHPGQIDSLGLQGGYDGGPGRGEPEGAGEVRSGDGTDDDVAG